MRENEERNHERREKKIKRSENKKRKKKRKGEKIKRESNWIRLNEKLFTISGCWVSSRLSTIGCKQTRAGA